MRDKEKKLLDKYGFGKDNNKYIFFPENGKFYLYKEKSKKVFFEGDIEIIGTYSQKSSTWRWAWSNRFVPANVGLYCLYSSLNVFAKISICSFIASTLF